MSVEEWFFAVAQVHDSEWQPICKKFPHFTLGGVHKKNQAMDLGRHALFDKVQFPVLWCRIG